MHFSTIIEWSEINYVRIYKVDKVIITFKIQERTVCYKELGTQNSSLCSIKTITSVPESSTSIFTSKFVLCNVRPVFVFSSPIFHFRL